jgi:hypothetical protein
MGDLFSLSGDQVIAMRAISRDGVVNRPVPALHNPTGCSNCNAEAATPA